jgi:acetyl esterase
MALDPAVESALPKFFGTEDPPPADPIAAVRERLESLAAYGPEVRGEIETRDCVIAGRLPVRAYAPGRSGGPALVFFHGGAWVGGSVASHDVVCRALAARLAAVVVSVDYRLAPEHLFPAAIDDAWLATQTVADDPGRFGAPGDRIVVGGDSAGGELATAVARRARDAGLELAGQMLVYPVVDAPSDRESYLRYAEGYGLTRAAMQLMWRTYLGSASDDDPDAAPLRCGDLSGLAPAVVVTAECDVLRDEAEEYVVRLREAGVEVGARRYAGLVHGFLRIAGEVPAARAAFDDLIALTSAAFGYGEEVRRAGASA